MKENCWPHPPNADRKTHPYSNILGARKQETKEGYAEEDNVMSSTFQEDLEEKAVSWHGARRIAGDRDRWRLFVTQSSELQAELGLRSD